MSGVSNNTSIVLSVNECTEGKVCLQTAKFGNSCRRANLMGLPGGRERYEGVDFRELVFVVCRRHGFRAAGTGRVAKVGTITTFGL